MDRPTTLYRFFDSDGALLYVGITSIGKVRWDQHAGVQDWWRDVATATVEHFDSRPAALRAERRAIRSERPRHNIVHSGRRRERISDEDRRVLMAIAREEKQVAAEEVVAVKNAAAGGASAHWIAFHLGRSHTHVRRIMRGEYDHRLNF